MERISDTDINCYLIDIAKTLNKMEKKGKSYRDFDMILKELKKYRETGLTPEEIMNLQSKDREVKPVSESKELVLYEDCLSKSLKITKKDLEHHQGIMDPYAFRVQMYHGVPDITFAEDVLSGKASFFDGGLIEPGPWIFDYLRSIGYLLIADNPLKFESSIDIGRSFILLPTVITKYDNKIAYEVIFVNRYL